MKNLNTFKLLSDYESEKSGGVLNTPNVSFVAEDNSVRYLLKISEDELDTAEYVDLGLPSGLKWASCNIGANKPCESGLLFQFGRVDGYAYGDNNHQFQQSGKGAPIPTTTSGNTYAEGSVLATVDDAAYYATNGKARMPTVADIDELLSNTSNKWCQCSIFGNAHKEHIVFGRVFTSNANGKKIFIPAAGSFNDSFYDAGSQSNIWSSSVESDYADFAYRLSFNSGNCYNSYGWRCCGCSVRGVCE